MLNMKELPPMDTSANPSQSWMNETAKQRDQIFNDLIQECRMSAPSARLSARLRTSLERFPIYIRKQIACRTKDNCAALFIACKRGNLEIVEYLIDTCDVDLEQKGLYEVSDDRSVHEVTPLWCAAVSGKLSVLKCLVSHGADINALSDTGSTPVRSACFMTHLEIVSYLIEKGADIHKPNYNGGTCLINSVQSVPLCQLLLEHGAAVNASDLQDKTALHYAIQEHRLETTRLLLEHGADTLAVSKAGDDALQIACLKGASQIFKLLKHTKEYTIERIADATELLGSTLLDEFNDVTFAISHWRKAVTIRNSGRHYIEKRPCMEPKAAFRFMSEFKTLADLDAVCSDMDSMRIQSLLVCERVLGPTHKDTVYRLMFRGAAYADALRYQRCIDLWLYALELRIIKDSLLFADSCYSLQALVRLFLDARAGRLENDSLPAFEDLKKCYTLLADHLREAQQYLEVRPVFKKQSEMFDRCLKCVTHLIYLLYTTATTDTEHAEIREMVSRLVCQNIRSCHTGDTLLHLTVSRLNIIRSTYLVDDPNVADNVVLPLQPVFPHCGVIKLLLDCGFDVNTKNESKSTALHVASIPYNFSTELVQLLLSYGAHIDQPNKFGDLPVYLISNNCKNFIPILNYLTLKCIAANSIVKNGIPYDPKDLPDTLVDFLEYHRP